MAERGDFFIQMTPDPMMVAQGFFMTSQRLNDLREPVEMGAKILGDELAINFLVGGRPSWAPLATSTVTKKGHSQVLIESGDLMEEVSDAERWQFASGGNSAIAQWEPGSVHSAYGHYHLSGTRFMPQRDFMTMPDRVEDAIMDIFEDWIDDILDDLEGFFG